MSLKDTSSIPHSMVMIQLDISGPISQHHPHITSRLKHLVILITSGRISGRLSGSMISACQVANGVIHQVLITDQVRLVLQIWA